MTLSDAFVNSRIQSPWKEDRILGMDSSTLPKSILGDSWLEGNEMNPVYASDNMTSVLEQNPESLADASILFELFHNIWKDASHSQVDIPSYYTDLCSRITRYLPKLANSILFRNDLPNIKNVTEVLELERDSWILISALYKDRLIADLKNPDSEFTNFESIRHSERSIIRLLYEKDSSLRETQIIIDWLERRVREQIEEVAENFECLFNQTLVWENTTHLLECLPDSELRSRRLPTDLHPDAITCSYGAAQLDHKDRTDEDRYLNYLFLCLRAGDMHRVKRLCIQRGECWRAVSLEGWRPFHFAGFVDDSSPRIPPIPDHFGDKQSCTANQFSSTAQLKQSNMGDDFEVDVPLEGNASRTLFKCASWWNAENPNLGRYERAIYATLSGNLDVLLHTLPMSWVDLTWAHCRALVEARVDSNLRNFLHTGPRANTLAVTGKTNCFWQLDAGLTLPDSSCLPADWTLTELFARVESALGWSALNCLQESSKIGLDTIRRSAMGDFLTSGSGPEFTNNQCFTGDPSTSKLLYCLFYAIQQATILRDFDAFLDTVSQLMPKLVMAGLGASYAPSLKNGIMLEPPTGTYRGTRNSVICHAIRFLAHFTLFLKSMEPELQDEACAQVLKAYLSVLIADRRIELVADYAAMLPTRKLRVQWYSTFLSEIIEPVERERCLSLAVSAGFNLQDVTRAVVRLLRKRQPLLPFQSTIRLQTAELTDSHANVCEPAANAELVEILREGNLSKVMDVCGKRIVSMEWLFYDPKQRGESLVVANSLLRVFIAMGSTKAAQYVLSKLPPGTLEQAASICTQSGSPLWLVNAIREHESLVMYLDSQDAFADWFQQVHTNRPAPPASMKSSFSSTLHVSHALSERLQLDETRKAYEARLDRWRHEVKLDTEASAEKLLALLTYPHPGWLVDLDSTEDEPVIDCSAAEDEEMNALSGEERDHTAYGSNLLDLSGLGEDCKSREMQMRVLRENCLTETVFLLVRLFQTAGMHKRCVEIADLVASKEHNLNEVFSKAQMQKLLGHISESLKALIAADGDPLGYPTVYSEAVGFKSRSNSLSTDSTMIQSAIP